MPGTERPEPGRFESFLEPGCHVAHPDHPEWGWGQVQSAIGARVAVNFVHRGKVVIDASAVTLRVLPEGG